MADVKENQVEEPPMDEILQTIRGVITGEDHRSSREAVKEPDTLTADEDDVLALTEDELIEEPFSDLAADNFDNDVAVEDTPLEDTVEEAIAPSVLDDIDAALGSNDNTNTATETKPLDTKNDISTKCDTTGSETASVTEDITSDASKEALKRLVESVPKEPTTRPSYTLEDLVLKAIQPHVSEWLDKNLPDIVTALVEKEIKRLVPNETNE